MTTVSPSHVQLTFKEKQQRFSTPKKENFKNIIEAGRFTNAQNYLEGVNRVPKYFLNLVDPILSNLRKKGNIKRIENINKIENTIRKKLSFGNTIRNVIGLKGKNPNPEGGKHKTRKVRKAKKYTRKH